ncbi:MAG TPA: hypothetical protein VGO50_09190 [Pyrinomonadaceae bacterium]|jgi:hypothetical protein|nr:hypothetical protein [Pyrinomonadaceae bacterium]
MDGRLTNQNKTALSFGITKEASLYFDHVVPLFLSLEYVPEFISGTMDILDNLPVDLIPEYIRTDKHFPQKYNHLNSISFTFILKCLHKKLNRPFQFEDLTDIEIEALDEQFVTALLDFINHFKLFNIPALAPGSHLIVSPDSSIAETNIDSSDDIAITLSSLSMIDVSKTPWNHIIEFRKDVDAKQKLRRLRLFATENYTGKSKSFIEDDLLSRLYDYDEEVNRWGFETRQSVLTMLLTSKTLGATLGGALISAAFGSPTASVITAVGGACIEVGRVALEVSRRKFLLRNSLQDNPISYIVDAKNTLKPITSDLRK